MKGGVLIIGSLYWQSGSTNEPWDRVRKRWREEYLLFSKSIKVKAPIRYGRYSSPKGVPVKVSHFKDEGIRVDTNIRERSSDKTLFIQDGNFRNELYTMVLSKDYDNSKKAGIAFICPLRRETDSVDDVKEQVKALSKAEGIFIDERKYFRKKWGGVSVWINEHCPTKEELYVLWRAKLGNPDWLRQFEGFDSLGSILKEDGTVNIDHFVAVEADQQARLDKLDFVLCAVTVPRNKQEDLKGYPNPEEIGRLAQVDTRRYFQNNHKNGIRTSDDSEIEKWV